MRLDGERVYLRSLAPGDAEALHALRLRNRTFFEPYEPEQSDADFTLEAVRRSIVRALDEERAGTSYTFGIFDAAGETPAGRLRLTNVFRGPWQNANLGYYVDRACNGRGFATEAVRLGCRFAFEHAGLHRVQAAVMLDNARSIRVLEKAGFRREGVALRYLNLAGAWRDHTIYAVTVEEFGK